MSRQDGSKVTASQRPTSDDKRAWGRYWRDQGWSWRKEPEIDEECQKHLSERLLNVWPPFNDVSLSRADVEWLLATRESEGKNTSPDKSQRSRKKLSLDGADLRNVNLSALPL